MFRKFRKNVAAGKQNYSRRCDENSRVSEAEMILEFEKVVARYGECQTENSKSTSSVFVQLYIQKLSFFSAFDRAAIGKVRKKKKPTTGIF